MLAAWVLARPAYASSAPLCDDRGATAIARPPSLEARDVAVERVRNSNTCPWAAPDLLLGARISSSHPAFEVLISTVDQALPLAVVALPPPAGEELDLAPQPAPAGKGVRSRVERPPRG
jgi:hypothetical protein